MLLQQRYLYEVEQDLINLLLDTTKRNKQEKFNRLIIELNQLGINGFTRKYFEVLLKDYIITDKIRHTINYLLKNSYLISSIRVESVYRSKLYDIGLKGLNTTLNGV